MEEKKKRGRPKKEVVEDGKVYFDATEYPGIKRKRIGMIATGYKVTYDKGRQEIYNPKTERYEVKQVKSSKMFLKLEDAVAFKEKMDRKRKISQGKLEPEDEDVRLTFFDLLDEFLDYENNDKTKEASYKNSVRSQVNHMKKYFDGPDERKYVDSITTLTVEDYFVWCNEVENLKKNSITHQKSTLVKCWKYLGKRDPKYDGSRTIINAAIRVPNSKFEGIALPMKELNRMIAYTADNEEISYLALIALGATGSLRRGEIAGLLWEDVDFDNRIIDIRHNRVQIGKKETVKLPKTNEMRKIPMHNFLYDVLKSYKEWQEAVLGKEVEPKQNVYMTKINLVQNYIPAAGKISRRFGEMQKRMNKYLESKGEEPILKIRLHDLRHTFVTNALSGTYNSHDQWIEAADYFEVHFTSGHKEKNANSTATNKYLHDLGHRDSVTRFFNEAIEVDIIPIIKERIEIEGKFYLGDNKKYRTAKALKTRAERAGKEHKEKIIINSSEPLDDIHDFKRKEVVEKEIKVEKKTKETTTKVDKPIAFVDDEPLELTFK